MLFVEYPKCTTCKKAKKFLDDHNIKYTDRDIKSENPTAEEIAAWYPNVITTYYFKIIVPNTSKIINLLLTIYGF